jgi:hypothetical protein
MSDQEDALRYRALRKYLTVERDEPDSWTCWLALACIPVRGKTQDPDSIIDWLVTTLKEGKPPNVKPEPCAECGRTDGHHYARCSKGP